MNRNRLADLLALAVLAQALLMRPLTAEIAIVGLALAAVTRELWRARRHLSPHADMLLLMAGLGGLTMALQAFSTSGLPACHRAPGLSASAFGAMWAAGAVPAFFFSRCLQGAKLAGLLWPVLLLDAVGMYAGMAVSHAASLSWPYPAHHAFMVAGMLLGMGLAMTLRPYITTALPWIGADVK